MRSKFDNLSKADMIELLKNKSKELGRVITTRDLRSNNELPSDKYIQKKLGCKTWNEVLQRCDLPLNKNECNFSSEELITILKNLSQNLGHSPTRHDVGKKSNTPSERIFYKHFNTNSWNEILGIARLEYNHYQGYSKEEALNQLRDYYNKNGKLPTQQIIRKSFKPSYDYYYDNFGSLSNAFYEAGLINKPLTEYERIKISIDELIKLANRLNKCPTVMEYENVKHEGYCRRELEKHINLKYNDICRKYIPQYRINLDFDTKTKEQLINDLIALKNKLGRTPMAQELNKKDNGITYSWTVYERVFNKTYNEIIKDLGWELSGHIFTQKTDEELLNDYYNLYLELERLPFYYEINKNPDMVSSNTYEYRFGNFQNVCMLLDIDYQDNYVPNGLWKMSFDKLGNSCRSSVELIISNYLIDNNISFKKEVPYHLHKGDRRRFDWEIIINNQTYYIEYAGLYDCDASSKICKKYNNNIRRKIKDLVKANMFDKCLFIFPNDIKNKSLDEIFNKIINKNLKSVS